MEDITRALLVMDGNYVRICDQHLENDGFEGNFYSIRFDNLLKHVCTVVEKSFGHRCVFSAKKCYMGTNEIVDVQNREFYRALDTAGIQRITFPLRSRSESSPRSALKEEACDTTIVFNTTKEFYSTTKENRYDTLVLFAGDGDLTPLAEGLKAEGVKIAVIYYDFSTPLSVTRASQKLLETADVRINLGNLLTERVDPEIISIFEKKSKAITQGIMGRNVPHASETETSSKNTQVRFVIVRKQPYTKEEILNAISSIPKKDADGYVLVASLGKYLEHQTGKSLPYGTKLKDVLQHYRETFETKELPAYSVRPLTEGKYDIM